MSSNPTLGILAVAAGLALGTGCVVAEGIDHSAVMKRWDMNYYGKCSSWLYSQSSGVRYCASPAFVARPMIAGGEADAGPQFDETKTDKDSLVAAGGEVYGNVCAACHQADGQGQAGMYPPLAGAGGYYGSPQDHARILVHGLNGEIEVLGKKYNGAMPAQGYMSDYELAAVATYVRHSWGNDDGIVMPADVTAVR
jgi:mono/diheme cytochrome c family protein